MAELNKYSKNVIDADLKVDVSLPSNGTTVYGSSFDLDTDPSNGLFVAGVDVICAAPAVTTTMLPDDKTLTYKLQESDDDSSFSDIATLGVQTGAGGAGADAVTFVGTLPTSVAKYIRLAIENSGTGNSSSRKADFKLAF